MNKTSFINVALLARLAFWTVMLVLIGNVLVAWWADDMLATGIYFMLATVVVISDSLHRIWRKVADIASIAEGMRILLPAFGKSMDFTSLQVVETNRLVMQRLVSDEERGKMVDLTEEIYGSEAAEKLEKYLFIGPLESIELDKEFRAKEEQEQEQEAN